MGILTGKGIFSSKWITAQITDAFNRRYFVPIKHTIGDYFLADIEGDVYCFKIEPSRIAVYQHTLVRSFRVIDYNLSHYLPISPSDNKELEEVLKLNSLPKMNLMLFNIMKLLGKREREEFTPHNLEALVSEVSEHEGEYKERVQNIKNYLSHLNVQTIVSPVRKISEFIEGDLLQSDPHFFGTIVTQIARVDEEHKKVTNTPEQGKTAWLKILLILAMVLVVVLIVWWVIDSGILENAMSSLPTFNFGSSGGGISGPTPEQSLMSKYPTPEALQAAIDRGEISEAAITPEMKTMLEGYNPPVVVATP